MAQASLANGAIGVRLESPEHIGSGSETLPGSPDHRTVETQLCR